MNFLPSERIKSDAGIINISFRADVSPIEVPFKFPTLVRLPLPPPWWQPSISCRPLLAILRLWFSEQPGATLFFFPINGTDNVRHPVKF